MSLRLLLAAIALSATAAGSMAGEVRQDARAVMELFTSQGCPSCPPADALLTEFAERDDVVALAYHVDYWDYIGWSDSFGSEANSNHQRDYAAARGSSRVFTPQMIVNGEGMTASRRAELTAAVGRSTLPLDVELTLEHEKLEVVVPPDASLGGEAMVWLVSFLDRADVHIDRGENKGKTVAYTQIVTHRQALGMWEPATGARFKLPLAEVLAGPANGAAVLVQYSANGLPARIVGAASFVN